MNIISNSPKNKDFLKQILSENINLDYYSAKLDGYCKCKNFTKIEIECRITDLLQRTIDYWNSKITSFQLELKMKDVN